MKHIAKTFIYLILFVCFLGTVSCGKISEPKPIDGSGYPHTYPKY